VDAHTILGMPLRPQLARVCRIARLAKPSNARAATWALVSLRRAKRDLAAKGLAGAHVAAPPRLPASARAGVIEVVRRKPSTCLERALVLQRWEAEHGGASDVIIGVTGPGGGFVAHAWLETMPDAPPGSFEEILRLPAPAR
jgi:hypothetical protein